LFVRRPRSAAFTLVELLVVIGIIVVLLGILLPTISRAREAANRAKCASNIHQIILAATSRASITKSGVYFPTPSGGSDALAYLIPDYMTDVHVALCPSTSNYIRDDVYLYYSAAVAEYGSTNVLQDMTVAATNAGRFPGVSYEIFGWYDGNAIFPDGTCLNPSDQYQTINTWLGLSAGDWGYNVADDTATTNSVPKRVGHLQGMTNTILVLDSDQDPDYDHGGRPGVSLNNWPDPRNNHGADGSNIGFADGHVSFVQRGPTYIKTFLASYGGMAQGTSSAAIKCTESLCPGLTITAPATINGHSYGAVYKLN
jgi:prepilin-type processing-associated H-X9-DG protein